MPTEFRTTPCSSCGRPIVWGVDPAGQRIPLDPRPPVYNAAQTEDGRTVLVSRNRTAMVSHFATCPHASQHSRSSKAQADPIKSRATSALPSVTSYGEPQGEAAQDALREVDL